MRLPMSSWSEFCDQLDHDSPSLSLGSHYGESLDAKSEDIFSSSDICIRISDLSQSLVDETSSDDGPTQGQATSACRSRLYLSDSEVRSHLESSRKPQVRIISIFSAFTLDPLQVTSALLQWIFQKYNIPVEFLEVFLSFGDGPGALEGCSSHVCRIRNGHRQDMAYEAKYYQRNERGGIDPWSLRHTGVLHCHDNELDLFIVLQPVPDEDSAFERRLTDLKATDVQSILEDPLQVHTLILTSYLGNWRPYLQFVEGLFDERKNRALVTDFDAEVFENPKQQYEAVRDLHGLQDTVSMAEACCKSYVKIFSMLQDCGMNLPLADVVQYQMDSLEGYSKSLASVQRRIDNASTLQGYIVNLRYQVQANGIGSKMAEMNEEVRDLAKSAQKDSSFITVITILSAIYIPGSFVATIFGTNFFSFNPTSQNLTMASNFWVFVAAWLPLTGVTILIFCMVIWWNAWLNRKSVRWPWKEIPRRRKQDCEKLNILRSA